MSTSSNSREYGRFDELAEEFAERYRRGERPSLLEYIDRLPEMADEIREMFPALVEVEQAKGDASQDAKAAARSSAAQGREIGDYRIVREVGRGGMGVVYEADQISLGRRVALKVLPAHVVSDRRALERFRREAKAAARLHHTNIVPVFEVGRDGDTAFYAMQFIQGQGLDQVIDELSRLHSRDARANGKSKIGSEAPERPPSGPETISLPSVRPPRRPLEDLTRSLLAGHLGNAGPEGGDAAYAVTEAASGSGDSFPGWHGTAREPITAAQPPAPSAAVEGSSSAVLPGGTAVSQVESATHRQPFYRSVAQIGRQTAQGLAYAHARGIIHRDIKPSNLLLDTTGVVWITDFGLAKAEEDGLTQTGDILGTLRYMAPERFRGEGDARVDTYALGLTLYELLTLKPAFDTNDRLRLIERVKTEEPTRPRSIDPRIPRDLETIVLKSIEKSPSQRYPTAEAMAEDLRRFLDDEPIQARRATPIERYARWARHNPGIAVLGAVLTAVLVLVTAGSLVAAGRFANLAERQHNLARVETLARKEAGRQAEAEAKARAEAEVAHKAAADAQARAEEALANAVDQTYLATRNEVRALRLAHESGWRAATLERISGLARLGSRNLDLVGLRSEATASLAERDLRVQSRFAPPNLRCWRVQFSPDGGTLAVNDSNRGVVHLVDLTRNRQLGSIPTAFKGAPFAFHPGGALAVVSAPGRVTYQALAPGQPTFPTITGPGEASNLAFSQSGERLAILWGEADPVSSLPKAPRRITIHETRTGTIVHSITLPTGINVAYKTPVALSPDGDLVATTGPRYDVRVYSIEGSREPVILGTLDRDVGAIAFHPDGRSLAACGKQVAVVWDLDTRTERARVHSGDRGFWDIAFSPNGQYFATISDDAMCRLWDSRSGRELASAPTGTGLGSSLAITPRGDRIAVGASSVSILVIEGGRELRIETSQTNFTRALVFDPTEPRLYHVGMDRHLYRWNLNESAAESIWTTRSFTVPSAMRMSPTGRDLIIGGARPRDAPLEYDDVMQVLPRENLAAGRRLKGPRSDIGTVAVSPSSHRIAAYSRDGKLYVWDYDSGTLLLGKPVTHSTQSLEFLDDARLLCASNDRIRVVSATDGGDLRELQLPSAVGCFVLTPDRAEALVRTLDGTIHRVSLPSLTVEQAVKAIDPASPLLLAISPDGSLLAATSKEDAGVALIDTKRFETVAFLPGAGAGRVNFLEFDPTGRYLACGEVHIRLWDLDLIREELGELGIGWDATPSASRPAMELVLEGAGPSEGAPDPGAFARYLPAMRAAEERVHAGIAASKERRFEEAVAALRQADAAFRGYRTFWSGDPSLARLHGISLGFLAGSLRELGKPAEASAHARRSIRAYESIADPNPGDFYNTACGWALVAALDAKVSPEERERCAARAVASLGRAIAGDRGTILGIIGGDHDLDILRGRADFENLLADARFPSNPFVATEVTPPAAPDDSRHDEADSLFKRAHGFARRGDWKAALADFQAGLALDRNHSIPWMSAATLYLKLGDVEGYRRHARAMFDVFGATEDPADAERTAKIGLLTPPPDEEAARLLLLADRAVTRGAGSPLLVYFQLARGMAAYRAGMFQDTVYWMEKVSVDSAPVVCRIPALAFQAMARARLGKHDEAIVALDKARQLLKAQEPTGDDLTLGWHDWLICRFAIQEAEDVLGQQAAKPAESPAQDD